MALFTSHSTSPRTIWRMGKYALKTSKAADDGASIKSVLVDKKVRRNRRKTNSITE